MRFIILNVLKTYAVLPPLVIEALYKVCLQTIASFLSTLKSSHECMFEPYGI